MVSLTILRAVLSSCYAIRALNLVFGLRPHCQFGIEVRYIGGFRATYATQPVPYSASLLSPGDFRRRWGSLLAYRRPRPGPTLFKEPNRRFLGSCNNNNDTISRIRQEVF